MGPLPDCVWLSPEALTTRLAEPQRTSDLWQRSGPSVNMFVDATEAFDLPSALPTQGAASELCMVVRHEAVSAIWLRILAVAAM